MNRFIIILGGLLVLLVPATDARAVPFVGNPFVGPLVPVSQLPAVEREILFWNTVFLVEQHPEVLQNPYDAAFLFLWFEWLLNPALAQATFGSNSQPYFWDWCAPSTPTTSQNLPLVVSSAATTSPSGGGTGGKGPPPPITTSEPGSLTLAGLSASGLLASWWWRRRYLQVA